MHTLRSIWNLFYWSYQYRDRYQAPGDVVKALTMRAAVGRLGSRLFHPRLMQIGVRGCDTPIFLRRGTSDFQIFMGLFEKATYDVVHQMNVGPAPFILDCGGNIGLASLRFSLRWPDARIQVVEPDKGNRAILEKNLSHLIDAGQCQVVEGFVGPADGVASIDRSGAASEFRMAAAENGGGEQITVYSISSLMRMSNTKEIDLLKVDIEGAESALFADCGSWISKVRNLLVEVDPPYTAEALLADLRRAGANPKVLHHEASEIAIELS